MMALLVASVHAAGKAPPRPLVDAAGKPDCHASLQSACGWTKQHGQACFACITRIPLVSLKAQKCTMFQLDHFCIGVQQHHGPHLHCDILCRGSMLLQPLLGEDHEHLWQRRYDDRSKAVSSFLFRYGFGEHKMRPVYPFHLVLLLLIECNLRFPTTGTKIHTGCCSSLGLCRNKTPQARVLTANLYCLIHWPKHDLD